MKTVKLNAFDNPFVYGIDNKEYLVFNIDNETQTLKFQSLIGDLKVKTANILFKANSLPAKLYEMVVDDDILTFTLPSVLTGYNGSMYVYLLLNYSDDLSTSDLYTFKLVDKGSSKFNFEISSICESNISTIVSEEITNEGVAKSILDTVSNYEFDKLQPAQQSLSLVENAFSSTLEKRIDLFNSAYDEANATTSNTTEDINASDIDIPGSNTDSDLIDYVENVKEKMAERLKDVTAVSEQIQDEMTQEKQSFLGDSLIFQQYLKQERDTISAYEESTRQHMDQEFNEVKDYADKVFSEFSEGIPDLDASIKQVNDKIAKADQDVATLDQNLTELRNDMELSEAWAWSKDGTDRFTNTYPGENLIDTSISLNNSATTTFSGWKNGASTVEKVDGVMHTVVADNVTQSGFSIIYKGSELKKNTKYFFGIDTKGTGNISITYRIKNTAGVWEVDWTGIINMAGLTSDYSRHSGSFVTPNWDMQEIQIAFYPQGSGAQAWQTKPKLEINSVATPYTPAPSEDAENAYPKYRGLALLPSDLPEDYVWDLAPENVVNIADDLAKQIGKNTDFRSFESDKSFMTRVYNESAERGLNVKWFGAVGDGVNDDTEAIQATIDYAHNNGGGVVYIPDGEYLIKAHNENTTRSIYLLDEGGVALKGNVSLKLSDLAVLKAMPNDQKAYQILRLYNVENCSIIGGKIKGDIAEHTGTDGEWGYGIGLHGSKNVVIKDVEIFECWGDGINLQVHQPDPKDFGTVNACQNILIENVNSHHNRRQGMSIESAVDVEIRNSKFNDTGKIVAANPSAGIDIEPWLHNGESNVAKNIRIINCEFLRNVGTGVTCMNNNVSDVSIKNCFFKDNLDGESQFKTYRCHGVYVDSCEFVATAEGRSSAGIRFANGYDFIAKNCDLVECYLQTMNVKSEGISDVTFLNNRVRVGKIWKPVWIANITSGERIIYEKNHIEYLGNLNTESNLVTFYVSGNNSRIIGNKLINFTTGIDVNGNNNYIADNEIHLIKTYGVVIRANFTDNTVENNTLSGCCYDINNVAAICSFGANSSIICRNTVYQYSFLTFPDGSKPSKFSALVEIQCSSSYPQMRVVALENILVSRMDRIPADVRLTNAELLTTRKYVLVDRGKPLITKGTTAERPLIAKYGDIYYDTTLSKPIFCRSGVVFNSDGTIQSNPSWSDAAGVLV